MQKLIIILPLIFLILSNCKISGTITDTDNNKLEGITVILKQQGHENITAITNKHGKYFFTHISSGQYTIIPGKCTIANPLNYILDKNIKDIKEMDFTLGCVKIGMPYGFTESLLQFFGKDILRNCKDAIEENNAILIKLSVFNLNSKIEEKLNTINALLVPGGYDINPALYKEKKHEKTGTIDFMLDSLELKALQYANDNLLPILGICRGQQMINVFYGGSLYQDIPTQFKGTPKVAHLSCNDICFHDIEIYNDTILLKIMGNNFLNVNSIHHQAVKKLAENLRFSAKSADGIIEGIENKNMQHFVLGVQFHPEKLRKSKPEFNKIFETFILETSKSNSKY